MAARPHPNPQGGRAPEVRRSARGHYRQPLIEYLALGDSYTIGTSVKEADSFPAQLAARIMAARGTEVRVTNLGVNGYTSADLIRAELPAAAARPQPELVTCLIGVNDHVQGVAAGRYREQVQQIYAAIAAMGAAQTIAVSIPDFSFTPQGRLFGTPDTIVAGLRAFNTIAAAEATRAGMPFVDIFDVSRAGAGSPGWLAPDGLHPGRAQYSAWVDLIWETVSLA